MKLCKLLSTSLMALCLALPMTACDGDDDGGDEAADSNGDTNADENGDTTDGGTMDITCDVFCEAYVTQCLQAGLSTEFETNDLCLEACNAWDQAGTNCRFEQIPDACDQAGNMGDAC